MRSTAYEKLLPPLVAKVRKEVHAWRNGGYAGASATSLALLHHWFESDHLIENADGSLSTFRYYFAQREAVETVIWLYEVRRARDKFDLLRFDASGAVSSGMFAEDWPRYVLKMATGAGKTKVLSLLIAWSFFHRLYEADSTLSRNFLVIAPNIIVLDRLRADFDGLKIFFNDPILPPNGSEGRNWRDDFQLTLHIQDDVRVVRETGNLFLTNIHRVFLGEVQDPSLEDDDLRDYFLTDAFGAKPAGKTTDSKTDLGEIIREIDELAVFNDEAHHIHDPRMAWFKSIQDIHHKMLQRDGRLALQVDVTATPRHDNGAIFVQTVSDYPLVEAIHQNVVKHPILPDIPSQTKLVEKKSAIFTEKYHDYLTLGVEEWKKSAVEHKALGKKAVLFVMVDDTRNCDEVGEYLQKICPELQGAVLVIHTKNNGEISEAASGKNKEELELLRKQSNEIDSLKSPYKAIVSVLMLKEGWDVRNVTVICGLRAYAAKSNILPEQTLGRGLRRMYFGNDVVRETVSVLGTPSFMDFVESIKSEGVTFEHVPMGGGSTRHDSLIVEVDTESEDKKLDELDIPLPRLSRRYQREFKNLEALDPSKFGNQVLPLQSFTEEETREIIFKQMLDSAVHHTIRLDGVGAADVERPPPRRRLRAALPEGARLHARVPFQPLAGESRGPRGAPQSLRAGCGQDSLRLIQAGDQCAHRAGDRHDAHRGSHSPEGDAPLPHRLAAESPRDEVHLQPHRRRAEFRRVRTQVRRISGGHCRRRAGLRQELPRRRLQARLREGQRGPLELHARLHRPHHGSENLDRRDQGSRGTRSPEENGPAPAMVRRRHRRRGERAEIRFRLRGRTRL
jgi:type III restriction enzyme